MERVRLIIRGTPCTAMVSRGARGSEAHRGCRVRKPSSEGHAKESVSSYVGQVNCHLLSCPFQVEIASFSNQVIHSNQSFSNL